MVEMPIAQGLGLTAMRSGTGMGVEVSSRGGSLVGKKIVADALVESRKRPLLLKGLAQEKVEFVAACQGSIGLRVGVWLCQLIVCHSCCWPRCSRSFGREPSRVPARLSIMLDSARLCLVFQGLNLQSLIFRRGLGSHKQ